MNTCPRGTGASELKVRASCNELTGPRSKGDMVIDPGSSQKPVGQDGGIIGVTLCVAGRVLSCQVAGR